MTKPSNKYAFLKTVAAASALAVLLPFASAQSADRYSKRDRFTVYAKVIRAEPIYRRVTVREPVKHCWTEQEKYVIHEGKHHRRPHHQSHQGYDAHYDSYGNDGTIVGGVVGGVIGNQLGRGGKRGNRIGLTIAGAIIGSAIANDFGGKKHHGRHGSYYEHSYGYEPQYGVRPVQRCKTVVNNRYEKRIDGYDVTYIHRGKRFKTRTRKDPGPRIKLNIHARPARYR